jgi:hypothetical protein
MQAVQLSERRAEGVQARSFGRQFPAADASDGICRADMGASGSAMNDALAMDANDNAWTLRSTAITLGQSRTGKNR